MEKIKRSKQTVAVRMHTLLEGSMRSILSRKAERGKLIEEVFLRRRFKPLRMSRNQ